MCLFLAETCFFRASALAAELSICTVVGSNAIPLSGQGFLTDISQNNLRIQHTYFAQSNSAMYSDSTDEVAIIDCFLVLQTIGVPLLGIIQPEVEFLVSLHQTQSAARKRIETGIKLDENEGTRDQHLPSLRHSS